MTPTELIITVIASILAGTCIGVLITLVAMRHLLHTKDARIKILNEQLEKWNQHSIETEEELRQLYKDLTGKSVEHVIAEMTVQAQHKESMNYWTAEGEMQQEDKRIPGSHQP